MRSIARFMDARNTTEGKFVSILLSLLLVFSFLNVTMFTDLANADDETDAGAATTFVEESDDVKADEDVLEVTEPEQEPAADPEPTGDEPTEEVNTSTEPETEEPEATEAETEEPSTPEKPIVTNDDQDSSMDESNEGSEAFEGSAQVGNITVKVTAAAGAVPNGTEVYAKRVSDSAVREAVEEVVVEEGKSLESYEAIDVTLVKDGKEIQPDGKVNVSFFDANLKGEDVAVYHVSDDASSVTEVDARQAGADVQSFDVEHFSIYVVAGAAAEKFVTYTFLKGDIEINKQIVKVGDELYQPSVELDKGEKLLGWKTSAGEPFASFGKVEYGGVDNVTVHADVAHVVKVNFIQVMDVNDPSQDVIVDTQEGLAGQEFSYTDPKLDVSEYQAVVGFSTNRAATEKEYDLNGTIKCGNKDINLYCVVKGAHWITFDSDGGSLVEAQFVLDGSKAQEPTPTKAGYVFAGWVDVETNQKFDFSEEPVKNHALKATWTPGNAKVLVIYWKQRVTDDVNAGNSQKSYDYWMSSDKTAKTDSAVGASDYANGIKIPTGFKYNATNSTSNIKVNADGSTIVNVKYDRVKVTVNFTGGHSKVLICTTNHKHKDSCYQNSFTGLFGAPLPEGAWNSDYAWSRNNSGAILLTSFDIVTPGYGSWTGEDLKTSFSGSSLGNGGYSTYYYNEQLDGSFKQVGIGTVASSWPGYTSFTVHQKYEGYELYKKYSGGDNSQMVDSSWWDKNGSATKDSDSCAYKDRKGVIASKLKKYTFEYRTGNSVDKTVSEVKYTAPLASFADYRPTTAPEGKEFDCWYADPGLTTKFDFANAEMPNGNLTVYAGYTAKKYTVEFRNGDEVIQTNNGVEHGSKIAGPESPVKEGYVFGGWKAADGTVFNPENPVIVGRTYDAYWIPQGSVKVEYVLEDGAECSVKDANTYRGAANAVVLDGSSLNSDNANDKFLYWTGVDGKIYYPGERVAMATAQNGVVVLTAHFGPQNIVAALNYVTNNDRVTVAEETLKNNVAHAAATPDVDSEGYQFIGWSTAQNGQGTKIDAGQEIYVNNEVVEGKNNTLYGMWAKVEAEDQHYTYNGEPHTFDASKASVSVLGLSAEDHFDISIEDNGEGLSITDAGEITVKVVAKSHALGVELSTTAKVIVDPVKQHVVVKGNTGTKTYNGDEQSVTGFTVMTADGSSVAVPEGSITLVEGKTAEVKGTDVNKYMMGLDEDSFSVTSARNYIYVIDEVIDGWLDIEKAPLKISIKGNTDTKTYNGEKQSIAGFVIENKADLDAMGVSVAYVSAASGSLTDPDIAPVAEGTNVGSYNMGLVVENFRATGDKVSNYDVTISVQDGWLKIEKPQPDVFTASVALDDWTYGDEAKLEVPSVTNADGATILLYGDPSYTYFVGGEWVNAKPSDAGSYMVKAAWSATSNLPALTAEDNFEIKKRAFTIKVNDAEKFFGEDDPSFTGTVDGLVSGDDLGVTYKRINDAEGVGSYQDVLDADYIDNSNYTVTVEKGDFKIKTATVQDAQLTLAGGSWTYDAENHFAVGSLNEAAKGYTIYYKYGDTDWTTTAPSVKNVSDGAVTVSAKATREGYKDLVAEDVTIQITARPAKVTAGAWSMTYGDTDSLAEEDISSEAFDAEGGCGFVSGEEPKDMSAASDPDPTADLSAAIYPGAVSVADQESIRADNPNYKIEFIPAELIITAKSLPEPDPVIDPENPDVQLGLAANSPIDLIYNGEEQKWKPVITDGDKVLEEGKDYELEYKYEDADGAVDFTNVSGVIEVSVAGKGNYSTATQTIKRYYRITPAPLNIVTPSHKWNYDGYVHSMDEMRDPETGSYGVEIVFGLVKGETLSVKLPTQVGPAATVGLPPVFTEYQLEWNGTAKESNYRIDSVNLGRLEISAKSIVPTPDPDDPEAVKHVLDITAPANVVYNGQIQQEKPVVKDGDKMLAENVDYTLSYSDDVTSAGVVTVTVTGIGNYEGSDAVSYEITPREVLVNAGSATMTYDDSESLQFASIGIELQRENRGLISGESLAGLVPEGGSAETSGSEVKIEMPHEVGEYFDATQVKNQIGIREANPNYSITFVDATLTVLQSDENNVVIEGINDVAAQSIVKTYDGQIVRVEASAVREGSTLEYSVDGSAWSTEVPTFLNAGTYEVAVRATNPNYKTVKKTVTVVINRAPVTVTAVASGKYFGAADPELTATVEGMVNGESAEELIAYAVTRQAGEALGQYEIVPMGLAQQGNYVVTYANALFTIAAAPVVPPTVTPTPDPVVPTPVPTPTPTPTPTPVVPTPTVPTPAVPTPTPAAPAPTPAAATPTVVTPAPAATPVAATPVNETEVIDDDATPQAAASGERTPLAETEEIADEGNPLGAFDEPHCWVHWVMLLGIIVTALYAVVVVRRRLSLTSDIDDYENQILGRIDAADGETARVVGQQAL